MRTELNGKASDVGAARPGTQGPKESRYVFAGIAVASIWVAVAIAAVWAPDMITGSQHEHLAIAALADWFYAAIATGLVLMAFGRRGQVASRSLWMGFTIAIGSIWLIVALASVFAPSMVTGTDPTTIPVASLVSPVAGIIATAFACVYAAGSPGREAPG